MAVIRVNKTQNYTVMSNKHLQEKTLSLKAKGLLSLMLALPDDWDYSIAGLCKICRENETAIKGALNELREAGYVKVTKKFPNQTDSGRIEYIYDIFECPDSAPTPKKAEPPAEKRNPKPLTPPQDKQPPADEPETAAQQMMLFTCEKEPAKKPKKKAAPKLNYAEFVRMTEEEHGKLTAKFGTEGAARLIEILDNYKGSKGKTYASDYRAILSWVVDRYNEEKKKGATAHGGTGANSAGEPGGFTASGGFRK